MGRILDLGPGFHGSGEKIFPRYSRGVAANFCSISSQKTWRASIFLHVASGILKKYPQEAEIFEQWRRQAGILKEYLCIRSPFRGICIEVSIVIRYTFFSHQWISHTSTKIQIPPPQVKRFSKFRMLRAGKLTLSPFLDSS